MSKKNYGSLAYREQIDLTELNFQFLNPNRLISGSPHTKSKLFKLGKILQTLGPDMML